MHLPPISNTPLGSSHAKHTTMPPADGARKRIDNEQISHNPSKGLASDSPPARVNVGSTELHQQIKGRTSASISGVVTQQGSTRLNQLPRELQQSLHKQLTQSTANHSKQHLPNNIGRNTVFWVEVAVSQHQQTLFVMNHKPLLTQPWVTLTAGKNGALTLNQPSNLADKSSPTPSDFAKTEAKNNAKVETPIIEKALQKLPLSLSNLQSGINALANSGLHTALSNEANHLAAHSKPVASSHPLPAQTLKAASQLLQAMTASRQSTPHITGSSSLSDSLSSSLSSSLAAGSIGKLQPQLAAHTLDDKTTYDNGKAGQLSALANTSNPTKISTTAAAKPTTRAGFTSAITNLMAQLAKLPPSIRQQLLPQALALPLRSVSLGSSLTIGKVVELATQLSGQLEVKNNSEQLAQLQQLLIPLQKMVGNTSPTLLVQTSALAAILQALPSARASQQDIQNTRQNIARWLLEETQQQLTRHASTQTANALGQLENPSHTQLQQELVLRWGEGFSHGHIRIDEEKPHTHQQQKEPNGNKNLDSAWHLELALELPAGDTLDTYMRYHNNTLSLELWCENHLLLDAFRNGQADLESQLLSDGITLENLKSHEGKKPMSTPGLQHTLIDIKT